MESSLINNTMLVHVAMLAWIFLGERPNPRSILGLDPATYAYALSRLKVSAAAAAYVGDGSGGELVGARSAGFGMVILAEEAAAKAAPDELPRLRAQADASVLSLTDVVGLVNR